MSTLGNLGCRNASPRGSQPLCREVGPFRLTRLLGQGGMGTAWRAVDSRSQALVAIKLARAELDASLARRRLKSEQEILAGIEHPFVVQFLESGTTPGGNRYLAMELVNGVSLQDHCDRHRLTIGQRLQLFSQVCQTLQYVHQRKVVHRDLKPSNILVQRWGVRCCPKLIDFGIAKRVDDETGIGDCERERRGAGRLLGTLQYMSPEQASRGARKTDFRSDVYSLGAILYQLLVGTPPISRTEIHGASTCEILGKIRGSNFCPPSLRLRNNPVMLARTAVACRAKPRQLLKWLKSGLDDIVMQALAAELTRRYASAAEMHLDIQRVLKTGANAECDPQKRLPWAQRHASRSSRWLARMTHWLA